MLTEQSERSFRDVRCAVRTLAILYVANQRRAWALAPPSVRVCAHVHEQRLPSFVCQTFRSSDLSTKHAHAYTYAYSFSLSHAHVHTYTHAQDFYQSAINEEIERPRDEEEEEDEDDEEARMRRDFLHLQYVFRLFRVCVCERGAAVVRPVVKEE